MYNAYGVIVDTSIKEYLMEKNVSWRSIVWILEESILLNLYLSMANGANR